MALPDDLVQLLSRLAKARSPLQRAKLLAAGWKSLRGLDPDQLRSIASRLGLQGAEGLLERLANRRGRLDRQFLHETAQRLRELDPAKLDGVLSDLRDPERRGELVKRGLDAIAEEAAAQTPPEPAAEPDEPTPTLHITGSDVTISNAEPAAVPPTVTSAPKVPLPERDEPRPPAKPRERRMPRWEPAISPAPASVVPVGPADEASDLMGLLARARTLIERFRWMRERAGQARRLGVERQLELLDLFPAEWSRRRIVALLVDTDISTDRAGRLIDALESRSARRWCAGIVLRRGGLAPDARDAWIERYGLFPVRRRAS